MNNTAIKNKQNYFIVKSILEQYVKCEKGLMVCENDTYFLRVKHALDSLMPEYRFILQHEFMLPKTNYWYLEYYSKSSYYRLRSKAIALFIDNL